MGIVSMGFYRSGKCFTQSALSIRMTSMFVLPLKWSLLTDEWRLVCDSFIGVLTELAGVPQTLFEARDALFVVTEDLVIKWVTSVFALPVVSFEVTIVFVELASSKVSLVFREAHGVFLMFICLFGETLMAGKVVPCMRRWRGPW